MKEVVKLTRLWRKRRKPFARLSVGEFVVERADFLLIPTTVEIVRRLLYLQSTMPQSFAPEVCRRNGWKTADQYLLDRVCEELTVGLSQAKRLIIEAYKVIRAQGNLTT